MPKVSVIIPTYNRANFIVEAIQSVLDQSFQDFEITVIDDGSNDNTKEVVASFKDLRIKYIFQENQGICIARNNGVKASGGEYVVFLDSDDALVENALKSGVQVLNSNTDVGLTFGQSYAMDESGHILSLRKIKYRQPGIWRGTEEIINLFYNHNYIAPSRTMLRRKAVIDAGLFDPAFSSGSEDFELWVRIAKKYATAYIAEPFAKYRIHKDKISAGRYMNDHARAHRHIYAKIFKDPEVGHLFASQRTKAYFHLHMRLAVYALDEEKLYLSRKYLLKALRIHPHAVMENVFFPWLYLFAKTCIPLPLLRAIRKIKR